MQRNVLAGSAERRPAIVAALLFVLRAGALAQTTPSLDELVQRHLAAQGGSEKLRAMESLKATGRFTIADMEFPITAYMKRTGLRRAEITIKGERVIQGFDGRETWTINPLTGSTEPKRGDAAESQRAREDADDMMSNDLLDYKANGGSLEFTGREEVHGHPAYKLKLINKHGMTKYIYLDAENYLELRATIIRGKDGPDAAMEMYPSDYKSVGGVMVAHVTEMRKAGAPAMKIVFDKIESNLPMNDSLFEFPAAAAPISEKTSITIPLDAIRVRVTQTGFDPSRVEVPANQPVTLAFTRETPSSCGGEVVFPSSGISKALPLGETVLVNLPSQPAGEIRFSCGMGMLRGMMVAR